MLGVFEYEPSRQSLSVRLEGLERGSIVFRDTVVGAVIDCATGEVVVSDKTEKAARRMVNIHHKIKEEKVCGI